MTTSTEIQQLAAAYRSLKTAYEGTVKDFARAVHVDPKNTQALDAFASMALAPPAAPPKLAKQMRPRRASEALTMRDRCRHQGRKLAVQWLIRKYVREGVPHPLEGARGAFAAEGIEWTQEVMEAAVTALKAQP